MIEVSIIVPIYHVEKYLRECVESLCNQTLHGVEIILIDDGSPDNSGKICDEFATKDNRVKVIHKANAGVSAARNDGLEAAQGEYVIFVDSDDYLPVNALELLYAKAKEENADIVIGDVCRIFNGYENDVQFYDKAFVTEDREYMDKLIQAVFYPRYCPNPHNGKAGFGYGGPCNKLVRRSMLDDNNIRFDVRVKGIFDDVIYSAYILAAAKKIAYINQLVYYYRWVDTSITHTYKANMPQINEAIFCAWGEFLEKYPVDGKFTSAYYANVLRRFDQSLDKYYFNEKNPKSRKSALQEMAKDLSKEPYCSVACHVDRDKLSKWHRILTKQMATGSAGRVWMAHKIVQMLVKLRRRSGFKTQ